MKEILILGPGCYRCNRLYVMVSAVVKELGLECDIVKITDISTIADYGVMQTPALIIDGELKSTGRLLSHSEIRTMLNE